MFDEWYKGLEKKLKEFDELWKIQKSKHDNALLNLVESLRGKRVK